MLEFHGFSLPAKRLPMLIMNPDNSISNDNWTRRESCGEVLRNAENIPNEPPSTRSHS